MNWPSNFCLFPWALPSLHGFASLQSITLPLLVARTLGDRKAVTTTAHNATGNFIQSLYTQSCRWIYFIFLGALVQLSLVYNFFIFFIRIGNQKEELKYCSFYGLFDRKSPTPSENSDNLIRKSPSLSRDSNGACSDRKPLLYRLRYHRGPSVM